MCFANVRLTVHTFSNYIIAQLVGNFNPSRVIMHIRTQNTAKRALTCAFIWENRSKNSWHFSRVVLICISALREGALKLWKTRLFHGASARCPNQPRKRRYANKSRIVLILRNNKEKEWEFIFISIIRTLCTKGRRRLPQKWFCRTGRKKETRWRQYARSRGRTR